MAKTRIDWIGGRYGRLVVRALDHQRGYKKYWLCDCDCGTETVVSGSNLRSGHTQSCGCLHDKRRKEAKTTHGLSETTEYDIWINMKQRCHNPNVPRYVDYGGRGIVVCKQWRNDFPAFLAYLGKRPSEQHTIERIDNNRGYEPGNVRWATYIEQRRNRRDSTRASP